MKALLAFVCVVGLVITGGLLSPAGAQVTQQWVSHYDGPDSDWDIATDLAIDGDGNVYVTGYSYDFGTYFDYTTVKYDAFGNQLWATRYNGPGNGSDRASSLAVDGDGNVYVTGKSWELATGWGYATAKYNGSGQQQWEARYNWAPAQDWEDVATCVTVDGEGNAYVTGGCDGGYATIKYNTDGQQQWVAIYSYGVDAATGLAVDENGNVYVAGKEVDVIYGYNYVLVKYNPAGQQQWWVNYNGPGDGADSASCFVLDNDGNVYITGSSFGTGGADMDYATIKYDSAGVRQWVARYDGLGNFNDFPYSLAVDGNGNVYVTGESFGSANYYEDYATVKYDVNGQQQWAARYNGPAFSADRARRITLGNEGSVYVTGQSGAISTYNDYTTIKYSATGQELWVVRYNGPGNSNEDAHGLAVDGSGNIYVTGESWWGTGPTYDYATVKYNQAQAVDPLELETPLEFRLKGASPNPFNASTAISYQLQAPSHVSLKVFDTAGRLVSKLVEERQSAGEHQAVFDGSGHASGLYLARLTAGEFTATQKLVLLK
jgi:uncharacterized delta-60 repeat protein